MKKIMANIKVFIAFLTNNARGKSEDVYERSYRSVYLRFGHRAMVKDFLEDNSWLVK